MDKLSNSTSGSLVSRKLRKVTAVGFMINNLGHLMRPLGPVHECQLFNTQSLVVAPPNQGEWKIPDESFKQVEKESRKIWLRTKISRSSIPGQDPLCQHPVNSHASRFFHLQRMSEKWASPQNFDAALNVG